MRKIKLEPKFHEGPTETRLWEALIKLLFNLCLNVYTYFKEPEALIKLLCSGERKKKSRYSKRLSNTNNTFPVPNNLRNQFPNEPNVITILYSCEEILIIITIIHFKLLNFTLVEAFLIITCK